MEVGDKQPTTTPASTVMVSLDESATAAEGTDRRRHRAHEDHRPRRARSRHDSPPRHTATTSIASTHLHVIGTTAPQLLRSTHRSRRIGADPVQRSGVRLRRDPRPRCGVGRTATPRRHSRPRWSLSPVVASRAPPIRLPRKLQSDEDIDYDGVSGRSNLDPYGDPPRRFTIGALRRGSLDRGGLGLRRPHRAGRRRSAEAAMPQPCSPPACNRR